MREYIIAVDENFPVDRDAITRLNIRSDDELIRCKYCKHFESNHIEKVNGIPLIVAHEICKRWGDGCKTSENGWCFMAERKEE